MSAPSLHDAAHRVDDRRSRSRQRKMGPSGVGTCRRRAAYRLHGVKATDLDRSRMPAILGTALHKHFLEVLRKEYGAVIEVTVEDAVLKGHVDAVFAVDDEAELAALEPPLEVGELLVDVEDLKSKSTYAMDAVRNRGPKRKEKYQVMLYADMLAKGAVRDRRFPAGTKMRVRNVRLRYLDRNDGSEYVWEQPFDDRLAAEARFWVDDVLRTETPEDAPRDQEGPGVSMECDFCPFLTACWGPERADGRARQSVLVRDDADVAQALVRYDEGRGLENEGKRAKEAARKLLDASLAGQYGEFVLSWSNDGEIKVAEEVDVAKMVEVFEAADLEVPTREVKMAPRISVTRPKPAPDAPTATQKA